MGAGRPGALTDPDLVAEKLATIETCVQELRTLARPAEIAWDVREARFALHTLQIAIQAALDVASHIVSDKRPGEPETNRELFDRLARDGSLGASRPLPATDSLSFWWWDLSHELGGPQRPKDSATLDVASRDTHLEIPIVVPRHIV
jgi:hypothetical protein